MNNESEVARFRQDQALREQAARLALNGPAITASHESIIARMEQGGEYLLQLFEQGRHQEAYALWQAGILEQ